MIKDENLNEEKQELEVIKTPSRTLAPKKSPRIVNLIKVGTVNIYNQALKEPLNNRYQKFYETNKWHLWLDLLFAVIILFLITFNIVIFTDKNFYLAINLGNVPIVKIEKNNSPLKINQKINQQLVDHPDVVVSPGEVLTVMVSYENQSDSELTNLDLNTSLDSLNLEYQLLAGNFNKHFDSLPAGQKAENQFQFKLISIKASLLNIQSVLTLSANTQLEKITSDSLGLKVGSDLNFLAAARYFTTEGDQLGFGPLPPKVNQTTTYRVFWQIDNSLTDLDNLQVMGVLPENVSFSGEANVTAGLPLKYDSVSRQIIWKVGKLNKGSQTLQASFKVAITPTAKQIKTSPTLVTNQSVTAKDLFSDKDLQLKSQDITTNLNTDSFAKNQGLVE